MMFSFFKKKGSTPQKTAPRGTPVMAMDVNQAEKVKWFERHALPQLHANRQYVLSIMLGGIALLQGSILLTVYPFVKPIPYIVKVNAQSGKVESQIVKATDLQVGAAEKKYFLGQFAVQLMEIDRAKTKGNFTELARMMLGKAIQELADFRVTTQVIARLAQTPTLTRVVNIRTVTLLPTGDAALIRVSTEETLENSNPIHKVWLITAHYKILPPTSEEDIYKNPLGIYITHFAVQEDSQ